MSKNTRFTHIGGGAVTELNTPSSAKSSQKNIFKPLIATSLALALGANTGNAENINKKLLQTKIYTATTDGPMLQFGGLGSTTLSGLNSSITGMWTGVWSASANDYQEATGTQHQVQWDSHESSYWTPQYQITQQPTNGVALDVPNTGYVDNLFFQFHSKNNREVKIKDGKVTYNFLMNTSASKKFVFSNGTLNSNGSTIDNDTGRGLKMGQDGTGDFTVGIGTKVEGSAELSFASGTRENDRSVALYGNLVLEGGYQRPDSSDLSNYQLQAIFAGDLKGNFRIDDYVGRTARAKLFFNNNANLDGDILMKGGVVDIEFANAGAITGKIYIAPYNNDRTSGGILNVVFHNSGVIGTASQAEGDYNAIETQRNVSMSDPTGKTTITFTQDGTIYGNVYAYGGSNTLVFKGDNGIINGNVRANSGSNDITFSGTNNTISGNIKADSNSNTITFKNTSTTNSIGGIIQANGGSNTITFKNTSTTNSVARGVIASSGKNSIIANGSITINAGGVQSGDANNDIQVANNLNIIGNISAEWGTNSISASTINLGSNSIASSVVVSGDSATKEAKNTIQSTNALVAYFSSIETKGSNFDASGKHTNLISGGNGSKIIIGAISGSGGKDNNTALNTNTIRLTGEGSIAVNGNISVGHTTNTFDFSNGNSSFSMGENAKLTVQGNGNNIFNFQDNTKIVSNITAEKTGGSGKNIFNISNDKTLTFESSARTATTLNTISGTTEIVFLGDTSSSTGTFSGNVATSGGNATFKFSKDNGTYGIIGTLSTSGAGQNIIDVSTNNVTISNDLTFSGSDVTGAGGNIINGSR